MPRNLVPLLLLGAAAAFSADEKPFHKAELIFPLENWHNHSSAIVEAPDGDLFVCWFHGSGERQADDVKVMAARRSRGKWGQPYELADTPNFPDTNATLFVDSKQRLWLFWPAILANTWESALMKYRVSSNWKKDPPVWERADNMLLIPKNLSERIKQEWGRHGEDTREGKWAARLTKMASDKLSARLGWFTRTHPVELPTGRILVPLYSDGFSFSLMGISDDGGRTWFASEPILGFGNIQPSVVRRRDGSLVAYMRDNGPPPKRIHQSVSTDDGMTWSVAEDSELPNPGASVEAIALKSGEWIMVYNDLESGRSSLAVSMSDDEGKTWKWKRHLEKQQGGQFHYPSVIQGRDGSIHVTYSYFIRNEDGKQQKSIKHAHFNTAWVRSTD
jgi:predicted neuraminidase